ncbi:flagellar basal body P-ring protein FlgI [Paracoccus contaminans]|uniref:Flagellar P-ring protein n=1 Tax=Paracoccus contaminans TaxID=1945662 RepID=A0A1W6CWQ7_9RHOB|nr:flagellar basal body P-ring protein FlgI [Paracoccus contaminans]ARJ69313.1 flagellar biosynthesis protein FlgA [Paracoccus contaminans]
MRLFRIVAILVLLPALALAAPVRIKDLATIDGVRGNDLVGYGLVVGLNGTGDSVRNAPYTEEMLGGLLERLGVNVTSDSFRPKNVAAVMVTGTLPPFARAGSQMDVTVAAIGDAKSLLGGTLIMTPLNAADGEVYAVAQGSVIAGGASAQGEAASVVQGVPTSGTIPSGARVEREVDFDFSQMTSFRIALRTADFTTGARMERAINADLGNGIATLLDAATILIDSKRLGEVNPARLVGRIENIEVEPESHARVVVDHRSGTIVMGEDVRISRVAVSQGNLTLRVRETPMVSQPNPFAPGQTVVVPRTDAQITQEPGIGFAEVSGESSLSDVVAGLNALGVRPRELIDILKAVHAAGALHAEFIVN